jgi:hypothetical protein
MGPRINENRNNVLGKTRAILEDFPELSERHNTALEKLVPKVDNKQI